MNILKKLNYIFTQQQKVKFVILFFIMFIGAIFELLGVSLILPFIQIIMDSTIIENNSIMLFVYNLFNLSSVNEFLLILSILLVILYIVKNIYLLLMYYAQYTFTFNNQMRMSVKLMECYLKKPYEFHLKKNSSEIIRSITTDVDNLFKLILYSIQLLSEILMCMLIGIFLFVTNIVITVVVILLLVLSMTIFLKLMGKKIKSFGDGNQQYYAEMIKWINQSLGGIKEIKVLNREQLFIDSYMKSNSKYIDCNKKSNFLSQVPKLCIETVCIVGILSLISVMIYRGDDISTLIPQLAVFAMAAFKLLPSVNRMNTYINLIIFYKPSIDLIYNDLKETENHDKVKLITDEDNNIIIKSSIILNNISFKYPDSNEYVFKNVFLEIPVNKSIGLIGPSGSGKTTIVDVILGLLKPEADGKILIDNYNVSDNWNGWSKLIGYIPQNIYLSDDSIRNNIAFGIDESKIDDSLIWTALEQAQLKEFVESLENSLETYVGERGIRLSGGQRQRIGIARALYHNPQILILDEATSALDNETEKAVMEAINSLQGKKTLIIIAHRLNTIKNCDLVYEIRDKKVKLLNR